MCWNGRFLTRPQGELYSLCDIRGITKEWSYKTVFAGKLANNARARPFPGSSTLSSVIWHDKRGHSSSDLKTRSQTTDNKVC